MSAAASAVPRVPRRSVAAAAAKCSKGTTGNGPHRNHSTSGRGGSQWPAALVGYLSSNGAGMTALALALLVGLTRVGKGLNGVGKGLNGVGKGLTNIGRGLKAGMQGLGEKSFAAKGSTLQAAASDVGAEAARTAFPMGGLPGSLAR